MNSPELNELATALVAAQAEFGAVPKGSVNPFFKSKYAALPDVVAHATPILSKHGLAVSQFIDGEYLGGDALVTYLLHTSGQYISHVMKLHLPKDDPQGQGSAVTYARRYAYMAALGLVADEDDDGQRASTPTNVNRAKPTAPAKPIDATNAPDDVKAILEAAALAPEDEFLNSLAQQYAQRGSLSEKQIAAGNKKAYGVIKNKVTGQAKKTTELLADTFDATEEEPF